MSYVFAMRKDVGQADEHLASACFGAVSWQRAPNSRRPALKIIGVDCFGYKLGYAHGEYVMSGGRAAGAETGTLVRLRTDEGLDGWGEITPLGATYLPAFTDGIRTALQFLAPSLMGCDPTNISQVRARLDGTLLGHGYAKSP